MDVVSGQKRHVPVVLACWLVQQTGAMISRTMSCSTCKQRKLSSYHLNAVVTFQVFLSWIHRSGCTYACMRHNVHSSAQMCCVRVPPVLQFLLVRLEHTTTEQCTAEL